MKEINDFDDLVNFTVSYGLSNHYKVFCLNPEEYKQFYRGQRTYTFLSEVLLSYSIELFQDFIDPCYLKNYKKTVENLNISEMKEYGGIATLNDLLSDDPLVGSRACCVTLNKMNPLIFLLPFIWSELIEKEISVFSKICEMGKDLMFVVLIRTDLFCSIKKRNERLEIIVHESIHITEALTGESHNRFDLESLVIEILNEYQRNKNKTTLESLQNNKKDSSEVNSNN